MMKRISLVLFLVFAALAFFIFMRMEKSTDNDIRAVDSFDIYRYVGMWYVLAYPEGTNIFKSDYFSYDVIDDDDDCLLERNAQEVAVGKICFFDDDVKDGSLIRKTEIGNQQYKVIFIDQKYSIAVVVLNNDKNKVVVLSRDSELSKDDLYNVIKPVFKNLKMDLNLS